MIIAMREATSVLLGSIKSIVMVTDYKYFLMQDNSEYTLEFRN